MTYNLEQHAWDKEDIWTLSKSTDMCPEKSPLLNYA